jgi:3',5'-cyclic AMP phosphodiesterase CpdA
MTLLPGNHDRLGSDLGPELMPGGGRVDVIMAPGLHLVRVDSTGPHNRAFLAAHGALCARVLDEIDLALASAPPGRTVVLALHHHPLPLPDEGFFERTATRLGWPMATELDLGRELVERARGRCDLVLHGHRHVPRLLTLWPDDARPLSVHGAGSTTLLGRARLFAHAGGALVGQPRWMEVRPASPPSIWDWLGPLGPSRRARDELQSTMS